jgi:iron complex transport system ATP-binding protein
MAVLHKVNLPALASGQLVALTGPNGSGKSTLLQAVAGLLPAQADTLQLGSVLLKDMSAQTRARHVRYLPQSLPGPIRLTVVEALLVAARLQTPGIGTEQAMHALWATLDALGLDHLADRYLDELSGGQQQMVSLAQTLVNPPEVLLLDEPLASLDLNYQHHVMRTLRTQCLNQPMLVIVVLHDLNMALTYADTLLVLHHGRLQAAGHPVDTLTPSLLETVFHVQGRVQTTPNAPPHVIVDHSLTAPTHPDFP